MVRLSILFVLAALAFTIVACGGNVSPPSTTQAQSSAPAKPAEPLQLAPRPAPEILHGAPPPTEDQLAELNDVARDIIDVSQGDKDAVSNLVEDLARFGPEGMTQSDLQALTADLSAGLKGQTLSEANSHRLAALLYTVMQGDILTFAQRTALSDDLRSSLTAAGSSAAPASAAAARVGPIAATIVSAHRGR